MVVAVLTNGCRRFDLCLVAVLTTIVAVLVCRRVGLSPFWFVAVLACRRFGCRRFGSVAVLVVAVSTCRRSDLYPTDRIPGVPTVVPRSHGQTLRRRGEGDG